MKNIVFVILATLILNVISPVSSLADEIDDNENITVLFSDDFENEESLGNYTFYRGNEPTGSTVYFDDGTSAGGSTAIRHSIINDPTGGGHGGVLKLEGQEVDFDRFTHASREMTIPLSNEYFTVIEYEAASGVDMEASERATAFGQAMLSYLSGNITANIMNALVKYGTSRSDFYCISPGYAIGTGALAKKNEWHKVKVKLKLKEAGKDTVIVDIKYCGRTMKYEFNLSGAANDGLTGFSICYDSWNNDGEFSAYYIDDVKVYNENEVMIDDYVTNDGIIAKDGEYYAQTDTNSNVLREIPENLGEGWLNAWDGADAYRTYNFDGKKSKNFFYLSGNGIVERRFEKAIRLNVPGIYEMEEQMIDNTASSNTDMRMYLGSENLYAGVVGNKTNDGVVFAQLKVGDKYLVSDVPTESLFNTVKLKMVVKSPAGIGDVYAKVWGNTHEEPDEWSLCIEDIDLPELFGSEYINWVGNYSKLMNDNYLGTGYFAGTKISKIKGELKQESISYKNADGMVIYDLRDVTDSLMVNASFTNTTSGNAVILPMIVVYDNEGNINCTSTGKAVTVPAFSDSAVSMEEFGFDGTDKKLPENFNSSWKVKVFFLDNFTESEFHNVEF